jgi:hypothetical protein
VELEDDGTVHVLSFSMFLGDFLDVSTLFPPFDGVEEIVTVWDVPFAAMAAQFVRVMLCVSVYMCARIYMYVCVVLLLYLSLMCVGEMMVVFLAVKIALKRILYDLQGNGIKFNVSASLRARIMKVLTHNRLTVWSLD